MNNIMSKLEVLRITYIIKISERGRRIKAEFLIIISVYLDCRE
jgi:hypothetical protein